MPTLLEIQRAVRRSLVEREDGAAAGHLIAGPLTPEERLSIYRNTFVANLSTALRLTYPAIHRLVGAEFFESAARIFMEERLPRSAYLDEYGAEFSAFLSRFPPAASLAYLPGVASLEWAVSRALHAADEPPLDVTCLAAIHPADQGWVYFTPHPSVGLVHADHPVNAIWRAVLARDDAAMAAIDIASGPVWLLVQRVETDVDIRNVDEAEWRFMAELCTARPLQLAVDAAPAIDAAAALADHLAAGRFISYGLAALEAAIDREAGKGAEASV